MTEVFNPESILADGEDYTTAVNPFTGFQGRVRKGTVAATLNNIALLDLLFLENVDEDQIKAIKQAVEELIPSLRAIGVFDLFNLTEWASNKRHPGRAYVVILYLKHYPEEVTTEIISALQKIQETINSRMFQSELQFITAKA